MTADNDSLLNAVFSAVTLPPVTVTKSVDHSEYHSTHIENHQVHSITSTTNINQHVESTNGTHFHHHSSISAHSDTEDEVKAVKEKLAQLATHDDQHSLNREDSIVSNQSSQPRYERVHSTASSHATSHTSDDTLNKIYSAVAERESLKSLTMGGGGSTAQSERSATITGAKEQISQPTAQQDHSRTSSIASSQQSHQSKKSLHSHHSQQSHKSATYSTHSTHSGRSNHSQKSQKSQKSHHTEASDDSDSTLTGDEGEYHNAPKVRAFAFDHHEDYDESAEYAQVPEITEEIVLEDSHGRILAAHDEDEFPGYAPPPPPQESLRSPVPVDLLSDLRNNRLYQQNMPDDETNTTISEARVESILGGRTNGHKQDSDSEEEGSTIVVLRSLVRKDFDSNEVIAVENSAIKRTASQVKPLDAKLKTELQQVMQTRAIEDDRASSTISHEEAAAHKDSAPTGVFLHRNEDQTTELRTGNTLHYENLGHQEAVVRHGDHEAQLHATIEPSHLVHLEKTQELNKSEFHAPAEPEHWEPRRFSHSSNESHGFEHHVYREHSAADHSDDEATLTSQDAIPPVKSTVYHLNEEPLVTSLRKDHPDDYPTYLQSHRSSISSKASSMGSHDPYHRPTEAYLHRGSDGSQQIRVGGGAVVSARNAQPPHLDSIPPGGYAYRRDTLTSHASHADSEHSTATYASVPINRTHSPVPAVQPAQINHQPPPQKMPGIPRPRAISKDNYSTVSSIALIPNLYDQPKVTERLRPVRAQDVLKTLEQEKPVDHLHHEEPVYDEVYEEMRSDHSGHHHGHHHGQDHGHHHEHHHEHHHGQHHEHHHDYHDDHVDHHQHYQPPPAHYQPYEQSPALHVAGGNVAQTVDKQTPHYAGSLHSVNSDGFVHVKKPIRQSRHEHYLPLGDHFVLQEGVNTLRGRWERGTFRNHEETESERNYALQGLAQAIGSSASSTIASKSRSETVNSAVSASTVTSKRSQPKSEISSTTVTESVASKRSKQSGPPQLPRTGLPKSRASTLQQIHEHEELHVPRSLDELRVSVGPPSGPILPQAPVTSPAYNEKFQSMRVVKSVRQFVQQWSHPQFTNTAPPVFHSPHVHAVHAPAPPQPPPHASDPVPAPRHTANPPHNDTSRRSSVQSQISHVSSISANSSVSQQSARRSHKESVSRHSHASSHQLPTNHHEITSIHKSSSKASSKQPSLAGSLPKSVKSNGSVPRSHHESAQSKRTSIDSQATLTDERIDHQTNGYHHEQENHHHHETPMSAAFEEHPITEVKIRGETHVLTELVPISERRALFEATESAHIHRNFSINRKNIQHDHLPPMVNLLD